MAHHVEPMDVDGDFDKENTFNHNNTLPCTEKGYEELDVSELNMKLRYSVTPASSPMSKSYTANCIDNRTAELSNESLNVTVTDSNLTRSLHSTIKHDLVSKGPKSLPLQTLPTDQYSDTSRNKSVLRPLDTTVTADCNVTLTISGSNDDENLSLPSTSSSALQTPEATTPTKEIPKTDGGSPIIRGLKSVLNMFRSSQSPIPPNEDENICGKEVYSPVEDDTNKSELVDKATVIASTPIAAHRNKDAGSKRSSPYKDSIVFNDDLEKELQWKDETTILFSHEKIPIHKLLFQQAKPSPDDKPAADRGDQFNLNTTVEYMDISCNDSMIDKTMTDIETNVKTECSAAVESDSEFLDCETTFTKHELDNQENMNNENNTDNLNSHINMEGICTNLPEVQVAPTANIDVSIPSNYTELLDSSKVSETMPVTLEIDNNIVPNKDSINIEGHDKDIITSNDNDGTKHLLGEVNITPQFVLEESTINKCLDEMQANEQIGVKSIGKSSVVICDKENSELQPDSFQYSTIKSMSNTQHFYEPSKLYDNDSSDAPIDYNEPANFDPTIVNIINDVMNPELPSNIPLPDDDIDSVISLPFDNLAQNVPSILGIPKNNEATEIIYDGTPKITANEITDEKCLSVSSMEPHDDIDNAMYVTNGGSAQNLTANLDITIDNKDIIHDVTKLMLKNFTNEIIEEKSPPTSTCEHKPRENKNESVDTNPDMSFASLQLLNDIENIVESNRSITIEQTEIKGHVDNIDSYFMDENIDEIRVLKEILNQTSTATIKEINDQVTLVNDDKSLKQYECVEQKNRLIETPTTEVINEIGATFVNDKIDNSLCDNQNGNVVLANIKSSKDVTLNITQVNVTEPITTTLISESDTDINPAYENSADIIHFSKDKVIDDKTHESIIECIDVNTVCPTIKQLEESVNIQPQEIVLEGDVLNTEAKLNLPVDIIDAKLSLDVTNGENIKTIAIECNVHNDPAVLVNNFDDIQIALPLETSEIKDIDPKVELPLEEQKENIINSEDLLTYSQENLTVEDKTYNNEQKTKIDDTLESNDNISENKFLIVSNTSPYQEELCNKTILNEQVTETISENYIIKDEEITVSENTSPFVSMVADIGIVPADIPEDKIVNLENTLATETETHPPVSPPIKSKGYNFNFDEMDDPFATKTKIRLSPHLNTPDKQTDEKNNIKDAPKREFNTAKRKSMPERKKQPGFNKNELNSTIAESVMGPAKINNDLTPKDMECALEMKSDKVEDIGRMNDEESTTEKVDMELDKLEISEMDEFIANEVKCNENPTILSERVEKVLYLDVGDTTDSSVTDQNKSPDKFNLTPEIKNTSSSEQSTYYSAGTSSSESIPSRNVFNLPEIDDMNFNPFATKSKMRQSPPPILTNRPSAINIEKDDANTTFTSNDYENVDKISGDKMETEPMEKESSGNLSNTTCSSKNTDDINATVREVNTEDEDTIEGPFLEAEDLQDIDKISDIDSENVESMQETNDFPAQVNDNLPGEMFIDAEAFEFLLNQNKSNIIADSGKESLFLKFDPLFAKRMSTEAFAALSKIQNRQSTPTKARTPQRDATFDKSPIAGPSNLNATYEAESTMADATYDDLNVTVTKPMMVVTPAVNVTVTPRNKSLTPTRPSRHSITFTSPAMAVIDRLLSMSANNSLMGQDTTFTHPTREQHEADIALTQLRELLAEKEINVYNLKSESKVLKDRLTTIESQMHTLETESHERLKKVNELTERLSEKTRINRSMAAVVEEYERTIACLIAEIEQDKKRHAEERMQLIKERDEQTAHLSSMEVSFSDLHSKYEKSKQIIMSCKAAEDTYKKTIKDSMENFNKMQNNYELLKQHATSKLNQANTELEKLNRSHEAEILKLNAMIKRKDLHITSLEETLTQKTKANEELTAICDELINKVG